MISHIILDAYSMDVKNQALRQGCKWIQLILGSEAQTIYIQRNISKMPITYTLELEEINAQDWFLAMMIERCGF
jgi:hypothetical protein